MHLFCILKYNIIYLYIFFFLLLWLCYLQNFSSYELCELSIQTNTNLLPFIISPMRAIAVRSVYIVKSFSVYAASIGTIRHRRNVEGRETRKGLDPTQ